jgi:hypothetical protein
MIIVLLTTGFPEDETLFARPGIQTDCDEMVKCGRSERPRVATVAAQKFVPAVGRALRACVRFGLHAHEMTAM